MWKQLAVGLTAVLLVAGLLSAADNSWRFPVPTQVSSTVLLFASAMSGKTVLFAMLPGGSIRALATQP